MDPSHTSAAMLESMRDETVIPEAARSRAAVSSITCAMRSPPSW